MSSFLKNLTKIAFLIIILSVAAIYILYCYNDYRDRLAQEKLESALRQSAAEAIEQHPKPTEKPPASLPQSEKTPSLPEPPATPPPPEPLPLTIAMQQTNPDYASWLKIPDTPIDYPLTLTPDITDAESPYLDQAFTGEYSFYGNPFLSSSMILNSQLAIAHSGLKNGSMFTSLERNFLGNSDYIATHKTIYLTDLYTERTFEILALYTVTNLEDTNGDGSRNYEDAFGVKRLGGPNEDGILYYAIEDVTALLTGIQNRKTLSYYDQTLAAKATSDSNFLFLQACSHGAGAEDDRLIVVSLETTPPPDNQPID